MRILSRRFAVAGLLGGLLLTAGCTFGAISTEKPVFTPDDAVSPAWLADTYALADPESGRFVYFRSFETGTGRVLEVITPAEEDEAREGLTRVLWWFPAEIVSLEDDYYAAHLLFEFRMKYLGSEPDARHGYWLLKHEGDALELLDVASVDKDERTRLAEARALKITQDGKLTGSLSAATLRGFLADLAVAAEEAPAMSADGERKKDQKRLARISRLPNGVEAVAYDFLAAYHTSLPEAATRDDPDLALYLDYLESLADRGVPQASYLQARLYLNGWGVEQDFDRARKLASAAVATGYDRANTVLGVLALNGFGEPVDQPRGVSLLKSGAEAGDPRAMLILANLYTAGTAVEKSDAISLDWLEKAAGKDLPDAEFALGKRYYDGNGVEQDDGKAFELFEGAAKLELPDALAFLGFMYEKGRGVEASEDTASQKYLRAAQLGQTWAQWRIGERLVAGTGITQDRTAGTNWLRKAADSGHQEAKAALAKLEGAPDANAVTEKPAETPGSAIKQGQEAKDRIAQIDEELAVVEAKIKKLCGGRICKKLADGRYIYRTETYNPPAWYFENGRLAPRNVWPK